MTVRRVFAVVLAVFAADSIYVAIRASFFSDSHGGVFWTSVAVIGLLAAGALWGARRLK